MASSLLLLQRKSSKLNTESLCPTRRESLSCSFPLEGILSVSSLGPTLKLCGSLRLLSYAKWECCLSKGQQQLLGLGIPTWEHKVFLDGPVTDVLCRAALKMKFCGQVLPALCCSWICSPSRAGNLPWIQLCCGFQPGNPTEPCT